MYCAEKIEERLDAAERLLGWRPVSHTIKQVDEMTRRLDMIALRDSDGKPSGGTTRPYTDKEKWWIRNERMRCMCDAAYFLTRYCYVKDQANNIMRFSFRVPQKIYFNVIAALERRGAAVQLQVLKARQLGMSTVTELLVAHRIIFTYGVNAIIASSAQQQTSIMASMIFLVYDKLPFWMQPPSTKRQESERGQLAFGGIQSGVSFQHGSQTTGIGRGSTPTVIHLSEVTAFPDPENLIEASLFRAVHESENVFMVLESTAEGVDNWWHKTWKLSKAGWHKGKARLCPLFLPWFLGSEIYPTRVWLSTRPVDPEWKPSKECRTMMAKAKMFVSCDPVLSEVLGTDWEMGREQAWYWDVNFEEYKGKGREKLWYQEMPCVVGDTRVSTDKGIIRIDQAQDARICESGVLTKWLPKGEKPIFELTTKDGRILRGTEDHKIRLADDSWKPLGELVPGDLLTLSRPMFAEKEHIHTWNDTPIYCSGRRIDAAMGRFLGYFMGDGCFNAGVVDVSCDEKDKDTIEDVTNLIQEITGKVPCHQYVGKMVRVRSSSVFWMPFLRSLGALRPMIAQDGHRDGYTRNVCVPECIMRSPQHVVKEFLRALYECDGHAYKDSPRVKLFSAKDDFLRDVQLLLLGFGIRSKFMKINRRLGKNIKGAKRAEYFGRSMETPAAFANRFYDDIGFIGARKQNGGKRQTSAKYSDATLIDEVRCVVATGTIEPVYDISVAERHCFSANGIEVHNCDDIECFQGSFDSVFGNDHLEELNMRRTHEVEEGEKNYKIYHISGHGIEDPEADPEDIDFRYQHRFIQHANNRGEKYTWTLTPLKPWVIDEDDEERSAEQADGRLLVFRDPEQGYDYTVGIDTGGGVGRDSTVIEVWRKGVRGMPDVQCAEFASAFVSHVNAFAYASAITSYYSRYMRNEEYESAYREPLISVEQIAAVGDTVQSQMRIMGYSRFFLFHQYDSKIIKKKNATKMGWRTSGWSRPLLVDGFVHSVKNDWLVINSPFLLREMSKFEVHITRGREKLEHAADAHDDRIFASAIAVYTSHDMEAMIERGKNRPMPIGRKNLPQLALSPMGLTFNTGGDPVANTMIALKTTRDLEDFIANERLGY